MARAVLPTLNAMQLPFPTDWTGVFGRAAPLAVEIGFGDGKFLHHLARQQPTWNVVGIERAHAPLTWTEKRLQRTGLSTVRLVYGEGLMALHCLFQPEQVRAFHLNFSDPWHKKRHHARRLVTTELLHAIASRLEPGGAVYIATDIEPYAQQIDLALQATPGLANAYGAPFLREREPGFSQTRYERKALAAGRIPFYFRYQRTSTPIDHPPPVKLDETMPNAVIQTPLSLQAIQDAFTPHILRNGPRTVHYMELYRSTQYPSLLVDTFIDEPLFKQHLMLLIQERSGGEFVVRMAEVGLPRATDGAHEAVNHLAEWLRTLHPKGQYRHQKVKTVLDGASEP
ncbi:MAG: tRNA (guanosine(46)-N7)-methyltransferase TrmB [Anaerolineae bacterium]|nr:tRNA (guanosine(46)-N7)-methyltransferase TrmB [Anaerolineae bacterium]